LIEIEILAQDSARCLAPEAGKLGSTPNPSRFENALNRESF
jgi:hypothetical protein